LGRDTHGALKPFAFQFMLRFFLILFAATTLVAAEPPNIVLIFADDLGYGDIGPFGAKGYATPNLDQLAKDGRKFTRFYVSSAVCSASRAALMTGCYHGRVGIEGALGPKARAGLNPLETTLAEMLKAHGYATGMVGKWHLGSEPEFLPGKQGFNEWLGLPYSNDMWPWHPEAKPGSYPALPLYDGEKVIDADVTPEEQATLPARYAQRAVEFIRRSKDRPFFLYFAPNMPHVPLSAGDQFRGKSGGGLYGDVISEIDWAVGEIVRTLDELKLSENTLVIFTSDNGPWLSYGDHAGSSGPLREGKGTSWDGGIRVPCIMSWPGRIPEGTACNEPLMTIDLLPTIARISGAKAPEVKIDGRDAWALLAGDAGAKSPHAAYFVYYANNQLQAVISGRWKLVLPHVYRTMGDQMRASGGTPGKYRQVKIAKAELYDLAADPSEAKDVADANPAEVDRISKLADEMRKDLGDSLTQQNITGLRPAGRH
ncbi:MAG TPA: sulfatase, partial [Chthoniobacteraceae bacterium]|nr:sulfatase [Chthoniobacteraceae bacterium]